MPRVMTMLKSTRTMRTVVGLGLLALAAGCGGGESSDSMSLTPPRVTQNPFGSTADGRPVDIITLRNGKGAEMTVLTYGGII